MTDQTDDMEDELAEHVHEALAAIRAEALPAKTFEELTSTDSTEPVELDQDTADASRRSWWSGGLATAVAAGLVLFAFFNWSNDDRQDDRDQVATSTPEVNETAPNRADLARDVSDATSVVTYGETNRPSGSIIIVRNSDALTHARARIWRRGGLAAPIDQRPDFEEQVVVSFTVPGDGCYREFVEFSETEPGVLTPQFDDTVRECIQPAINWTALLAIDRDVIGAGFTVRLPGNENYDENRRQVLDLATSVSDGTTVIGLGTTNRPLGDVGVAQDAKEYERLIDGPRLPADLPQIDHANQVVVSITLPGGVGGPTGECAETGFLDFVETEPGVLTAQFGELNPSDEVEACPLPGFTWFTLLAIERNAIGDSFILRIPGDDSSSSESGRYEENRVEIFSGGVLPTPEDLSLADRVSNATTVVIDGNFSTSERTLGELIIVVGSAISNGVTDLDHPDFENQVLVSITVPGGGCPVGFTEFRETEPNVLTPHFNETQSECEEELVAWTTIVAIDRDAIGDGFTIRLPGNTSYGYEETRLEITAEVGTADASEPDLTDTSVDGPVLRYRERAGPGEVDALLAEIEGTLELEGDCLYIVPRQRETRYPIVWPAGTMWDASQQVVITATDIELAIGDDASGAGGYFSAGRLQDFLGPEAAALASACVDNKFDEVAVVNNFDDAIQ